MTDTPSPLAGLEIKYGEQLLPVIHKVEHSTDDDVSPKGAIGGYQVMPGTARQYGFDPAKLKDPLYNERVAAHILNDLWNKFHDPEAVLVGYNAGPTVARRWVKSGKQSWIPVETLKYLNNANKYITVGGKPLPPREPSHDAPELTEGTPVETASAAPGQKEYQRTLDAGFSQAEADQWKARENQKYLKAGFTPNEIAKYWGETEPDTSHIDQHVGTNIASVGPDAGPKVAQSPMDALAAGWGMSVAGLLKNQAPPQTMLPENAGLGMKVAAGAAQLAGDLPAAAAGFFAGASVAAPTASFSGPIGPAIGGGFGAAALPQAMREIMLDYYNRGEIHSSADFMAMASGSVMRTAKAGIVGAIAAPLGLVAGKAAGFAVGRVGGAEVAGPGSNAFRPYAMASRTSNIVGSAADIGTQVVAATTASAAMEGRLPDSSDFATAAVTMLGYSAGAHILGGKVKMGPAATKVETNLKEVYRETGMAPWQVMAAAQGDRVVQQEVMAEDPSGAPVIPALRLNGPSEPEPYNVTKAEIVEPAAEETAKTPAEVRAQAMGDKALQDQHATLQSVADAHEAAGNKVPPSIANALTTLEDAGKARGLDLTGGGGGGQKPPEDNVTPPGGQKPKKITQATKLSPEILNEIAGEFIGEPKQPDSLLDPKKLYRQWISELGPARAIDKMLMEKGYDRDTQLGLEDMFRQTYASDTRTGYFIQKGALDPITLSAAAHQDPTTGKMVPVRSIMDAVNLTKEKGGNLRDWINYMVAMRAIDKTKQGFETGHPLTPSQLEDLTNAGHDKYAQATGWLQQNLDAGLEYGRLSSLFSERQVEAIKRDNPIYVSFRRIAGDEVSAPPKGKGRGFKVAEPVSRFEGDDRKIKNPLVATIDNLNQIIRMADRNRAMVSVITLAEQHGMLEDLGLVRVDAPEIKMAIAEPGSGIFKPYDLSNPTGETYAPFLAQRAFRNRFNKNQFMVIRDGKPEVWQAKDEALATLLRGADSPGEANAVLNLAGFVAKVQRTGIVNAVDFPLRNVMRDQIQAFIMDPHSPPPFITWLRGAFAVFGGSDKYWDWVGKGGAGTALVEMDINRQERMIGDVFEQTGTWDRMWNTVRHPIEAMQILSEKMDAASRVGYKSHLEGEGIDPIKAATMGRKAFLDFVEKGTSAFVQGWARVTPFMRPTLLGYKQFGEALSENAGSTLLKTMAAVTVPTMLFYAMNWLQDQYGGLPEDQKFANLPRYWKDGMYVLPQVGGVRLRVPYPPVIGVTFGGLVTRFLDRFANDDPEAFKHWANALVAQVIPPFIPSIVLPPLEQYANRNFFTGHPLIPGSLEKNTGPMQYTENTTEPAKKLAQIIHPLGADVSPITIENYAREWTGSLGMAALKMLNAPMKAEGKPWEMADVPFVGSFLIRSPGMSAQPIQDFYDMRDDLGKATADKALAQKRLRQGSPDAETEMNSAIDRFDPMEGPNNIADSITNMQSVIAAVNNDKTLTKDEKRQFTDDLYGNMIFMAKAGLKIMRDLKAQK